MCLDNAAADVKTKANARSAPAPTPVKLIRPREGGKQRGERFLGDRVSFVADDSGLRVPPGHRLPRSPIGTRLPAHCASRLTRSPERRGCVAPGHAFTHF